MERLLVGHYIYSYMKVILCLDRSGSRVVLIFFSLHVDNIDHPDEK